MCRRLRGTLVDTMTYLDVPAQTRPLRHCAVYGYPAHEKIADRQKIRDAVTAHEGGHITIIQTNRSPRKVAEFKNSGPVGQSTFWNLLVYIPFNSGRRNDANRAHNSGSGIALGP